MTIFSENFWGQKNQGFACLYHNMKSGQVSTKDLSEFLKERALIEDNYYKSVSKLARSASNNMQVGTFAPFWAVLKSATDKLAASHQKLVQKLNDIVKDVQKYGDEQHKKHKTVKGEVSSTAEVVNSIQTTTDTLARAKELYNTRCIEFEKLKREGITGKDLEKAETKYKKALDDYKNLLEKYSNFREDFQKKMTDTCQKFEALEEAHLEQLKTFIKQYNIAIRECHTQIHGVQQEFTEQCDELTEEKLIGMFADSKGTGKDKPVCIEFEECDISNIPMPDPDNAKTKKKKAKKGKKKKDKEGESPGNSPDMNTPQVDEEGYSIKPDERLDGHGHFYSDSEKSDSDSDGEDRTRRIRVEIKPRDGALPQSSATVDQIKASLGGLTLSPPILRRDKPNGDVKSRRAAGLRSSNQSNSAGNLLDLDLFSNSPSNSGILSPSGNDASGATTPDSTLSSDLLSGLGAESISSPQTPPIGAGDLTRPHSYLLQSPTTTSDSLPPALPAKQRHSIGSSFASASSGSIPSIPSRPSSRPRSGMQSPSPAGSTTPPFSLPRQDSNSSLSGLTPFNATTVVGGSRGPSPLTLGMGDTIPIAAAFTESVNAYFKGNDQSKCMVKITGDLMLSFPAGIIQALTSNPQPPMLAFRVKNVNQLEQVLPNKQLISSDAAQTTSDHAAYIFNMSNLVALLKRQVEKNAAASYFNVDILKYQVKVQPDGMSTPLHLSSYWKCEPSTTDLRVDYSYNSSAITSSLTNVSLIVPVDGGVTVMQSKPAATWSSESKRVLWKIGEISATSEQGKSGSLRARFELSEGPSKPATLAVQFSSEGSVLSGVDIELMNTSYRLSLVKKRFGSGKYLSES